MQINSVLELDGPFRIKNILQRIAMSSNFLSNADSVQSIIIHERSNTCCVSEWQIFIGGIHFTWVQRERFDFESGQIHFKLITGDFENLQGIWKISNDSGISKVSLTVDYELGIVLIDRFPENAFQNHLKKIMDSMVSELVKDLITNSHDDRLSQRYSIDSDVLMRIDDTIAMIKIENISKGGIGATFLDSTRIAMSSFSRISFGKFSLNAKVIFKENYKQCRMIFVESLSEDKFRYFANLLSHTQCIVSDAVQIYDVVTAPTFRKSHTVL